MVVLSAMCLHYDSDSRDRQHPLLFTSTKCVADGYFSNERVSSVVCTEVIIFFFFVVMLSIIVHHFISMLVIMFKTCLGPLSEMSLSSTYPGYFRVVHSIQMNKRKV